jgi:iron complex outermembrane receptor protein
VLTNLSLFSQSLFLQGLTLSASVYNLFDHTYDDPGSEEHLQDTIAQNGRSFRLKLVYSF